METQAGPFPGLEIPFPGKLTRFDSKSVSSAGKSFSNVNNQVSMGRSRLTVMQPRQAPKRRKAVIPLPGHRRRQSASAAGKLADDRVGINNSSVPGKLTPQANPHKPHSQAASTIKSQI